jgi:hypothetical protein
MKKLGLSFVALLAFLLTTAIGLTQAAPLNCQDLLDANVYSCDVQTSFGGQFHDCFRFSSSPFALTVDGLFGQVEFCGCGARRSSRNPDFGASKDFECVTPAVGAFLGIAFGERISHRGILEGEATSEFGDTFVYQCVVDPTCELNGAAAAQGTGSWYK